MMLELDVTLGTLGMLHRPIAFSQERVELNHQVACASPWLNWVEV